MIFRSPYPDVAIPEVPLTPYVLRRAQELADKPALIDGPSGRTLTYGQLAGAVRLVAASLAQRGFQKGDVFAIYSPNLPEYAVAFHAVASLGGINTTINPLYTADELAYQLNDAGARLLLSHPAIADAAVIPSPDEEAGEIPKAFVVLRGEVTADEIMAFVAGHVAPHKKIRRVEFVEQIPKSAAGKILRRVLVERERGK